MTLAAFLAQAHLQTAVLAIHVRHAHRERRTHPGERKYHQRKQRPIPRPDQRRDIDAVEQPAMA